MQSENVKEYKLVREEMITVKDCITKYIGFVLGGSGAAVYGIAHMGKDPDNQLLMITVCFPISIIIHFALLVLFYKFHSHNRFAGYCKLLNHERYTQTETSEKLVKLPDGIEFPEDLKNKIHYDNSNQLLIFKGIMSQEEKNKLLNLSTNDTYKKAIEALFQRSQTLSTKEFSFFAWEVSVDKLRYWDTHPNMVDEVIKINIGNMNKNKLTALLKKMYENRKENFVEGFKILWSAILGKGEFRSWAFPPLVVAVVSILSFGFLITGCIFFIKLIFFIGANLCSIVLIIILLALLGVQIRMWYHYLKKLHALMEGSTTIDAFFWRFMPIRASFLNSHGITPEYIAIEIDEEFTLWEQDSGDKFWAKIKKVLRIPKLLLTLCKKTPKI